MKDRNDTPGLGLPLDTANARQLVEHVAQSAAIHSKSEGWLPMIKLDLYHRSLVDPGETEVLELLVRPDDLKQLLLVARAAMDRAHEDASRGVIEELNK